MSAFQRADQPEPAPVTPGLTTGPVTESTVEELIRHRLALALGGKRGMVEAAIPTLTFTTIFLSARELRAALVTSVAMAVVALVVRLAQRSTVQFALNSLIGIGIAAAIAARTGRAEDVFLPGIIYNAVNAAILLLSIAVRWPLVGLLIGSATGDPTGWRQNPAVVKLCTRLTWILVVPTLIRVAVQYPLYLADKVGWLAATKLALGWPLHVAAFALMAWVLARGRTPLERSPERDDLSGRGRAAP